MYNPQKVKKLLNEQGMKWTDLAEYVHGTRLHTVDNLKKEGSNPTSKQLELVAECLGVSMDYLCDRCELPAPELEEKEVDLLQRLCNTLEVTVRVQDEEISRLRKEVKKYELKEKRRKAKKG